MKEPKISVIVPVYNCERFIRQCLQSLMEQSYRNFEVLLINDGSTDGSEAVIADMIQDDPRFFLYSQENQGVCAARNFGLSLMTGTYLTFLDGDDYLSREYLTRLAVRAVKTGADVVFCGYTLVFEDGRKEPVIPAFYRQHEREEWAYRISAVCSRLYKTSFWKEQEFRFIDEPGARGEDMPLAIRANAAAKKIAVLKDAGYFYVQHADSAMNRKEKVIFTFPYRTFSEMYRKIGPAPVNSREDYLIGIAKALAQFEFVIYRRAPKEEKARFRRYAADLLREAYPDLCLAWRKRAGTIDLPILHKAAITLFLICCGRTIRQTDGEE